MKKYDHTKIEKKWQELWAETADFDAHEDPDRPKFYGLIEFPYPSGDGLHVGHVRSNTAMDIIARKRRREGYSVLYPIGWDAFGLPTENYALKTGVPPQEVTKKNTDIFRKQLKALGFSFDWSREINTSDPSYYKWTQWIFLKLFEKGLAYKKKMPINWCIDCKTGLANEEAIDAICDRCGGEVEMREKEQWLLKITEYAERLDKDLDTVDYLEKIKTQQRNWIGRSEGVEIEFKIKGSKHTTKSVKVFTTRPDTLFGATYLVLAPEHPVLEELKDSISNGSEVEEYIKAAQVKKDIERTAIGKKKTGVRLDGVAAVNPADEKEIPVFIADYVLAHYGTGAIMAVPAHDERDYEFAEKFDLEIKYVIEPCVVDETNPHRENKKTVERETIHAIVKDVKKNKILCLDWRDHPWITFVVGGVDEGEDHVDAARREVYEETGYKNLKLVKVLGGPVRAEYFAAHKDENRVAHATCVYFELEDDEQDPISEKEEAESKVIWKDVSDVTPEVMKCSEIHHWLARLAGENAYTGDGQLIHSGEFNGLKGVEAKRKITELVGGETKITFKLRDWIFSRQRYWGEPIPIIHCDKCGMVPVPENDLPVELPKVERYEPTDGGESPLAAATEWLRTPCPKCDGEGRRETDTMPNWAGSSWYYLRYADPHNDEMLASKEKLKYWTPVDWYNGGMEHTTLHLLYSRFWHKFLYDIKVVPTAEPYQKRTAHGFVLAEGGEKMSKSKGNVINPDKIVEQFGADTLRVYEMFMGPFEETIRWSADNIVGPRRFLEKVWRLQEKIEDKFLIPEEIESLMHKTIKKVSEDIEKMHFNTAVSTLMIFVNELEKETVISKEVYGTLLGLLAPFAPHITEELWEELGDLGSIHKEPWPTYDESKIKETTMTIAVQVNGKVRGDFEIASDAEEDTVKAAALALPQVKKWLGGKTPTKIIYVKGRLVSVVT